MPVRASDGGWHAQVTMGTRLDGSAVRKHVSGATKAELDQAVRALERSRDTGQYVIRAESTVLVTAPEPASSSA